MARTIDIEQLLIWAYRDEAVNAPRPSPGPARLRAARIYDIGALGTRVDGGGLHAVSLPDDALTVEAAVNRLPVEERMLVVQHATAGTRPDWKVERAGGVILVNEEGEPLPDRRQAARKPKMLHDASRHPVLCYVRFAGTTADEARERWLTWMVWQGALQAVDAALRKPGIRLTTWELAAFSLPRMPWRDDPDVPSAFIARVFFTKRKNVDIVSAR
jgi:hypothetical protein